MEPSPGSAKLLRKPSESLQVPNVVATQTPIITSSGIRSHHQPNCLHQKPSPLQAPRQAREGSRCNLIAILTDQIRLCRPHIKSNCLHLAITPRDFGWSLWDKKLVSFFTDRSSSVLSWYMLLTHRESQHFPGVKISRKMCRKTLCFTLHFESDKILDIDT